MRINWFIEENNSIKSFYFPDKIKERDIILYSRIIPKLFNETVKTVIKKGKLNIVN